MFGSILSRMILWELVKVFVMSLIGITGILLMAGIVAEASQQGLGPTQILAAVPLLIPSTLPYTIPATTLFATCVVYGRLAADNEILAIKSAGVNIAKVLAPGLLLGVVMSGATMGLYYRIIPYTHHLLRQLVFNDAEELLYTMLSKNQSISSPALPYSMFVSGVQGRKLLNPIIKHKEKGKLDVVAQAREAEMRVDLTKKQLLVHMKSGISTSEDGTSYGQFENQIFPVDLPDSFLKGKTQQRPRDMSWQEILDARVRLTRELRQRAAYLAAPPETGEPEQARTQHHKEVQAHMQYLRQEIIYLDVELLMRPALSVGCLCFILVGCPVGIWFSRSDYLSSFITCFLPIVFLYYPLMLCGTGFAKEGKANPVLFVWGANLVVLAIGAVLFRRLLRN